MKFLLVAVNAKLQNFFRSMGHFRPAQPQIYVRKQFGQFFQQFLHKP